MTDKVQKIREEVVRMHNLLPVMDGDNISVNYADRICTTLEMYIDSLQEEPVSEELEKAAKKEAEIVNALGGEFPPNPLDMELIKTIFIHGAEWQKEKEYTCYEEAFEDGASWKKEEMMKDAIDAEVTYGKSLAIPSLGYKLDKEGLDYGDKVKVIIIKED